MCGTKSVDVRAAKIKSQNVENRYASIGPVPFERIYDSEQELLADLRVVHIMTRLELAMFGSVPPYKGYEYIHSFAKTVQNGAELSEKQMKQAKRLAKEIKKAAAVADCF